MAKYDLTIREEELKLKVAKDWFDNYDTTQIIDNIDFAVAIQPNGNELFKETEYLLWAEAKKGSKQNIYDSVVQLIFTIGKGRINEKHMPPKYVGAFDAEKIAFIPYNAIMEVFSQTDFNWNVPPSDHSTKEFHLLKTLVRHALEQSTLEDGNEAYKFDYVENRKELKLYISSNFKTDNKTNRGMRITMNNFVAVYNQWRKEVMPTIAIDFNAAKKDGLLDSAFYLADLMSGKDNHTILDKLKVLLRRNKYILVNGKNKVGLYNFNEVVFKDNMQAHKTFWARYQRPPKKEYWDKIVERNDLLVPQDIREVRGEYFTPSIWVEKSQEYLAEVLGENWQDEYYIWDCCAGTGNLLANLTNKYNIWASTFKDEDVHIMHERIATMGKGSNLLDGHVFQFDFLNDELFGDKVPEDLKRILKDPEERKKLIIYINPPYKEASNATTVTGNGENQKEVAKGNRTYERYLKKLGKAARELYVQFLVRIFKELNGVVLGEFSTLKALQASNYATFRELFTAKLESLFIVPSNTFDNVDGKFPIGFHIWRTDIEDRFSQIDADVYDDKGVYQGTKHIFVEEGKTINTWLKQYVNDDQEIAAMSCIGTDFQHSKFTNINQSNALKGIGNAKGIAKFIITKTNLIEAAIYLSVRTIIESKWHNNRDQFLFPRKEWKNDIEFHNNCLVYTLFSGQNKISSNNGINHWIPYTEIVLEAHEKFQSHFMSDFLAGKIAQNTLFGESNSLIPSEPIQFSHEAQAVMDAGRELWYYYMHHKDNELYGTESINVNASYYDIRRYFQGVNEKGIMNKDSQDKEYMHLLGNLKQSINVLAAKIIPKVYLYGFLLDETTLPEDEKDIVTPQKPLPVKPAKRTPKPKAKSSSVTIVKHYHIDTYNDNSTNYNIEK